MAEAPGSRTQPSRSPREATDFEDREGHRAPFASSLIRGLRPRTPYTRAGGDPRCPAPRAWLPRSAPSPFGDIAPGPPTRALAGTPDAPRRARGSLAPLLR